MNYQKGTPRKQSNLMQFNNCIKKIKYLGIILTKDVNDLYSENYDTEERN